MAASRAPSASAALLNDGVGDTIRVSLTEDSVHEIPVAKALAGLKRGGDALGENLPAVSFDPFSYARRVTSRIEVPSAVPAADGQAGSPSHIGGEEVPRVAIRQAKFDQIAHKVRSLGDFQPDFVFERSGVIEVDPRDTKGIAELNAADEPHLITVKDGLGMPVIAAFRLLAARITAPHPILLKDTLTPSQDAQRPFLDTLLESSVNIGSLLCDGIGDAILVQGEEAPGQSLRLAFNILQAAGARIFKTDYVACPSCGRTLFDLQSTTAKIKASTLHLKGVKIAIMGCIVNGPGEMADADFGYVGGAPGKVNLYVGKQAVKFNIPEAEAVDRLKDLIREHGKWVEPVPVAAV